MPRSLRFCLLGLALLAACGERRSATAPLPPLQPDGPVAAPPAAGGAAPAGVAAIVDCEGSVASATITCGPAAGGGSAAAPGELEPAGGPLTLGGQGENVLLTSSGTHYNPDMGRFTFTVTVKNLLGQALGTDDGTTLHADGVRVFFISLTRTGGTGFVGVFPDGYATFTAALQPYYQYDEVLQPDATSAGKEWTLTFAPTVTSFRFRVGVAASVRYRYGWMDVAPAILSLKEGATAPLAPAVRNALGRAVTGIPVTWTSSDATVATVDAAGVVTGQLAGSAVITASSTLASHELSAAANVNVVATPFEAVADAYPESVIGNVAVNSARISFGVLANDACDGCVITGYDGTSAHGGTVAMTTSGPGAGRFTYDPPPGYKGTDSFSYTLGLGARRSTAAVSLTVEGMIWFLDAGRPNGDGRLSAPFNNLAAAYSAGLAGDILFLHESASDYAGNLTLKSSQKLVGQDAVVSWPALLGLSSLPVGSDPLPAANVTPGASSRLTGLLRLGRDNTLQALTLGPVFGTSLHTLAVHEVAVEAGSTDALRLSYGDLSGEFTSVNSSGGVNGIYFLRGTGLRVAGGRLSGHSGPSVLIEMASAALSGMDIAGGDTAVSFSRTGSSTLTASTVTSTGPGVSIRSSYADNTAGVLSVILSGNTLSSAAGSAVYVVGDSRSGAALQLLVEQNAISAPAANSAVEAYLPFTDVVDLRVNGNTAAGGSLLRARTGDYEVTNPLYEVRDNSVTYADRAINVWATRGSPCLALTGNSLAAAPGVPSRPVYLVSWPDYGAVIRFEEVPNTPATGSVSASFVQGLQRSAPGSLTVNAVYTDGLSCR